MAGSDTEPAVECDIIAGWRARSAPARKDAGLNALTIDVEDYFQVEAFARVIDRSQWDSCEQRTERNVESILQMLDDSGARATFFTLAWIGKRFPRIVRRIVASGHELASHGSDHRRADTQNRLEFLADVRSAKAFLEDLSGCEVKGYRAPSFSISRQNLWVMDALCEAGYRYSSSTYPIHHDNYGIPDGPRFPFFPLSGQAFLEIPVTSFRWLGRNWPCGGGGYFRLLPYQLSKAALQRVRAFEQRPLVFYFHPWEIDRDQPRIRNAPVKARFRHYLNIGRMPTRLQSLLKSFAWGRVDTVFLSEPAETAA